MLYERRHAAPFTVTLAAIALVEFIFFAQCVQRLSYFYGVYRRSVRNSTGNSFPTTVLPPAVKELRWFDECTMEAVTAMCNYLPNAIAALDRL